MDKWFLKDGQICFKTENAELNNWDLECVVSNLNRKDTEITELEAKLEESEQLKDDAMYNFALLHQDLSDTKEKLSIERRAYNVLHGNYSTLISAYDQLKQQLAEKEKEISVFKAIIDKNKTGNFTSTTVCNAINEFYEPLVENLQNQIAIAELEKLKEWLNNPFDDNGYLKDWAELDEYIDQQIKELKGEK